MSYPCIPCRSTTTPTAAEDDDREQDPENEAPEDRAARHDEYKSSPGAVDVLGRGLEREHVSAGLACHAFWRPSVR